MEFDSNFSNNLTDNSILDQPNKVVAYLGLAQPQLVIIIFELYKVLKYDDEKLRVKID